MEVRLVLLLCLLLRIRSAASQHSDVGASQGAKTESARPAHLCRYDQKELHTTVRSAALSALNGLCNPAEMEARLSAMEQRLSRQLEDIKDSFSRVLSHGRAPDTAGSGQHSGGTAAAGSGADAEDSDAELTHYNEFRGDRRRGAGSSRRRTAQKRHGGTYKRYNASSAASKYGARSQSAARSDSHSRSASAQTGDRGAGREAAATSRTASRDGAGTGQTSSAETQDRFASTHTTRSSSVRSIGAGAYPPAAGQQVRRAGSVQHGEQAAFRRSAAAATAHSDRHQQSFRNRHADARHYNAAGGSSLQYMTHNATRHASGMRQVSWSPLGLGAGQGSDRGNNVAYSSSYTPAGSPPPYTGYSGARPGHLSKQRRTSRRQQAGRRRGQHVTDTVSYVSSSESALQSRFREVAAFNDTVYEINGKRMFSYYWEVKDFDTMMANWEERHSLRSPSFYIYQGGYRMYIRVFPSKQGGNVYLHAGLTPGRYDEKLRWPFRLRLRLSLLDHSAEHSDIRSRVWEPTNLCSGWNWRKPTNKDNYECVGLGFPQQLVRSRRFLLDGGVLIKLDVFLEH